MVVDLAAVMAKLEELSHQQEELSQQQHEMGMMLRKITVPTETINIREAAKRLTRSTKWVHNLHVRQVFTDGRAPELRTRGSALVFYADEIEVYRTEGEKGVARLRRELGRK